MFCRDNISMIENYHKAISDDSQMWVCHHRRGTIYSKSDLEEIGEYYHRPAIELIFMPESEHKKLHMQIETSKRWSNGKYEKSSNLHSKFMCNQTYAAKRVAQYYKNGLLVREYDSARDAYRMTGISYQHISCVCNGKRKSAGGYIWKFI